ncbi:MAG: hypothetical protein HYV63_06670 [Candidatus Schekmanbacteria bacterium]|nr:hypothetical protein [Candidatus Schekmanbacteria bacterium]
MKKRLEALRDAWAATPRRSRVALALGLVILILMGGGGVWTRYQRARERVYRKAVELAEARQLSSQLGVLRSNGAASGESTSLLAQVEQVTRTVPGADRVVTLRPIGREGDRNTAEKVELAVERLGYRELVLMLHTLQEEKRIGVTSARIRRRADQPLAIDAQLMLSR